VSKVTAPPSYHSLLLFGQFRYSLPHKQCLYVLRMDIKRNLIGFNSLKLTSCLMTIYHAPRFSLSETHWNIKLLHLWSSGICQNFGWQSVRNFCINMLIHLQEFFHLQIRFSRLFRSVLPKYQSLRRHIPYDNNLQIKYVNFWVIPRRLVYIGRRFGTPCQVHLQRLEVSANINQTLGIHPKVDTVN
jgi:hypothetical protein